MVSFTVRNLSRPANLAIPGRREGLQFMLAFGAGYGLVWLCTRVISKMKATRHKGPNAGSESTVAANEQGSQAATPQERHSSDAGPIRTEASGSMTSERSPSGSYTSDIMQTMGSAERTVSRPLYKALVRSVNELQQEPAAPHHSIGDLHASSASVEASRPVPARPEAILAEAELIGAREVPSGVEQPSVPQMVVVAESADVVLQ